MKARPATIDWSAIADLVSRILEQVHAERKGMRKAAAERGISLEELTAAAITAAVRERVVG